MRLHLICLKFCGLVSALRFPVPVRDEKLLQITLRNASNSTNTSESVSESNNGNVESEFSSASSGSSAQFVKYGSDMSIGSSSVGSEFVGSNGLNETVKEPKEYHKPRPKGLTPKQMDIRLTFYEKVITMLKDEFNSTIQSMKTSKNDTQIHKLQEDVKIHRQNMTDIRDLITKANNTVIQTKENLANVTNVQQNLLLKKILSIENKTNITEKRMTNRIQPLMARKTEFEGFKDAVQDATNTMATTTPKIEKLHKEFSTLMIRVDKLPNLPEHMSRDWADEYLTKSLKS